jgi:hypothetical protein
MRWDEREGQRRVANYRGIVQSAGNLGSLVADKVQGTDDWYFDLIAALRRPADVACPTAPPPREVVVAAEERVKSDHSRGCASLIPGTYFGQADKQCTCGHDALAAALKGNE